ncbi:MAG: hypothetical protein U0559_04860 [Anaerolineae bacterium]
MGVALGVAIGAGLGVALNNIAMGVAGKPGNRCRDWCGALDRQAKQES